MSPQSFHTVTDITSAKHVPFHTLAKRRAALRRHLLPKRLQECGGMHSAILLLLLLYSQALDSASTVPVGVRASPYVHSLFAPMSSCPVSPQDSPSSRIQPCRSRRI